MYHIQTYLVSNLHHFHFWMLDTTNYIVSVHEHLCTTLQVMLAFTAVDDVAVDLMVISW